MNVLILSRSRTVASTRRLVDAAKALGHRASVVNPVDVELVFDGAGAALFTRGKPLPAVDAVIPRISASGASYALALAEQFLLGGVTVLNTPAAIGRSRNLVRCLQTLVAGGVPVPPSVTARDTGELKALVGRVGGLPVLAKVAGGRERKSTLRCERPEALEAALDAVLGLGEQLVLQQLVQPVVREVRYAVVGGSSVACVEKVRKARPRRQGKKARVQFRAGTGDQPGRAVAEAAARTLGLEFCSVDLVMTAKGAWVVDVDATPPLGPFAALPGADVARAVMLRVQQLVSGVASRGVSLP